MISVYSSLLQSLAIIVGLILVCLLLRRKGIITENERPVFGRLVTDFALPALIFSGLASQRIEADELLAVGIMAFALLVASFGSSSTLGYALISQAFPKDPATLAEAVVISELGVGILIFSVGVAVAIYFGQGGRGSPTSGIRTFIKSPIFISLVLGLSYTLLEPSPSNPALKTALDLLFRMLDAIGSALVIFVAMAIALMLRPIPLRKLGGLIVAVALIKPPRQALLSLRHGRGDGPPHDGDRDPPDRDGDALGDGGGGGGGPVRLRWVDRLGPGHRHLRPEPFDDPPHHAPHDLEARGMGDRGCEPAK